MAWSSSGASFCTTGATVTGTGGGPLVRSAAPPPHEQAERSPRPAASGASVVAARSRRMRPRAYAPPRPTATSAGPGAPLACGGFPLTTAPGEAISLWPAGAGDDDAAGTQCARVPPPAPPVDRQGRPRTLDGTALVLPERAGRAADRARCAARAHVARAEPARPGAPRPPLSRVVPAHVAPQSDPRGDPGRLPLVAGCRGALVGGACQATARAARDP